MGETPEVRFCGAEVGITVGAEDVVASIIDISGMLSVLAIELVTASVAISIEGGGVGVTVDWGMVLWGVVAKRLVDEVEQSGQRVDTLITKVMVPIVAIKAA
jgi:hypothetical protein